MTRRERKDLPAPQRSQARAGPLQGGQLTDDGRWIVVDGRRWRKADPSLPDDVRARLLSHLGVARSAVRTATDPTAVRAARDRVQLAKVGLGERGPAWWDQDDDARRTRWEAALAALDG
jgi:hypothetical protein